MKARFEYRMAPGGRQAVCLTGDGTSGLYLEAWSWTPANGWQRGRLLTPVVHPQMLPMDDGRVLVYDSGEADPAIWSIDPDGRHERLTTGELTNIRLVAAPRADGRPGLAIRYEQGGSVICRLQASRPGLLEPLAKLPGVLLSAGRLDAEGTLLAIERADVPSGPTEVVLVNVADGSWETLLDVTPDSHDSILLADPRRQLVVVGTDATGVRRIGWTRLGDDEPLRFPSGLNPDGEPVEPLAVSPSGQELLLHRVQGVRSTLLVHHLADDTTTDVPLPPAHVHSPAKWTADALTVVLSTPTEPARPVTVTPATAGQITPPGHVAIETLAGAHGDVEALVYGGPNWRDSDKLLIALHGGPLSAWRYEFDPLLHQLANAGVAVVAPNQRGSTGYGRAHALAIKDNWGGPDLADILRIAADLHAYRIRHGLGRSRLRLYGHSYGAFLALLAAAEAPHLWAKCAALAPFTSAADLHPQAGAGVRNLIDQLGGRTHCRDVRTDAGRIEADLLIAHGARDPMVPVEQSRTLRQHLLDLGRRQGHDLHYLEPADGTHELMTDPAGAVVRTVVAFLAGPGPNRETSKGGERSWVRPATFA